MEGRIFVLDDDQNLTQLDGESFASEEFLQRLIADHPELLDGGQINPTDPRRWILIRREQGIADTLDGASRWSVDHLMVDQDGILTFVEVKRSSDTRIRREVVGQMLDYAAHATQTMKLGDIRRDFEGTHGDKSASVIAAHLASDDDVEPDIEEFWERVAVNLAAKRIRLLFVADEIPDELATVVEFLNEQMPNIEVLAVSIKQYKGDSLRTLVPQVIGRTAAAIHSSSSPASRRQPPMRSVDEFYDRLVAEARNVAERLIGVATAAGAEASLGSSMVTVRVDSQYLENPCTVAELFASGRDEDPSLLGFTLGRPNWNSFPAAVEQRIGEWLALMSEDGCFERVGGDSSGARTAWAMDPAQVSDNVELLEQRLREGIAIMKGDA